MTTKQVHQREQNLDGVSFKVKTILPRKIFGTQFIWNEKAKIAISDSIKTVVDKLDDPAVLGGIRIVADILLAYINSKEFNSKILLEYAKKMNNSAIFKRLGFLVELLQVKNCNVIMQTCKNNLKSGYSQLDPAITGECLETRWNLWVPKSFSIEAQE